MRRLIRESREDRREMKMGRTMMMSKYKSNDTVQGLTYDEMGEILKQCVDVEVNFGIIQTEKVIEENTHRKYNLNTCKGKNGYLSGERKYLRRKILKE